MKFLIIFSTVEALSSSLSMDMNVPNSYIEYNYIGWMECYVSGAAIGMIMLAAIS